MLQQAKTKIKDKTSDRKQIFQLFATFVVILLIGIINTGFSLTHLDTDMLWHYIVGRDTLLNGGPLVADTYYTWQTDAAIWNQHEWLFDIFLYGILNVFGPIGQSILYGFVVSGIVAFCLISAKPKNPFLYSIFALIINIVFPFVRCNRPIKYSVYILAFILILYRKNRLSWWKKYLSVFLLTVLLVNLHGGMIITELAMLFIMPMLGIVTDIINPKTDDKIIFLTDKFVTWNKRLSFKEILIKWIKSFDCFVIALVGSIFGPEGYRLLPESISVGNLETTKLIQEWLPLKVNLLEGVIIGFLFISFGYGILRSIKNGFACFNRDNERIILDKNVIIDVGLSSAFIILAMYSQKAFDVTFVVLLLFGYKYFEQFLYDITTKQLQFLLSKFYDVAGIIATILLITYCSMSAEWMEPLKSLDNWANQNTSIEVLSELKRIQNEQDKNIRIGHGYNYGNTLIWNDIPCFVDTRQMMYDDGFTKNNRSLNDLFSILASKDEDEVRKFIEKYEFEYIVTDNEFDINWYLKHDDSWSSLITEEVAISDEKTDTFTLWKHN